MKAASSTGWSVRHRAEPPLADAVTAVLASSQSPMGAYEISRVVGSKRGRPVHPNTVYRIIRSMIEDNQVLPVAYCNGFLLRDQAILGEVMILLCKQCKSARQLTAQALAERLASLSLGVAFRSTRVHLEVLGRCPSCSNQIVPRQPTEMIQPSPSPSHRQA